MKILIKNGRVLNPDTNTDITGDVLVYDDRVKAIGENINEACDEVIDASGCFVMPGFIDLHVHFREPGFEYKETIKTGSMAAAAGGYTTVCPMPNTNPVIDSPEMVRFIIETAKRDAVINVLPIGAVTKGQLGKEIADIKGMKEAGAVAISEDGKSVMDVVTYKSAMKLAAEADIPVMAHCEEINLARGGVINESKKSEEFGLCGISNDVEDLIEARDIILAKSTGARLHLCHCSTRASVAIVKGAKEAGVKVSAEVCPHHFSLTSSDITSDDGNFKMNPPLRERADVEALIRGLSWGIMDAISTDHAPHSQEEKSRGLKDSPFGIVGLETAASLAFTRLVEPGFLSPLQMADRMSAGPARIIGIEKGSISAGRIADIVIFDPSARRVVDKNTFFSKGRNTPFHGMELKGRVVRTIAAGKTVYDGENVIA